MMRIRTGIVHNMLCVKSESIIWIVDLKFKYLPSSPRHITTTDGDPACRRSSLLELSTNRKISYGPLLVERNYKCFHYQESIKTLC